jgi:hypothetical protein
MKGKQGYGDLGDAIREHARDVVPRLVGNDLGTIQDDWSLLLDRMTLVAYPWGMWNWSEMVNPQNPPGDSIWLVTSIETVGNHGTHGHDVIASPLLVGDRVLVAMTLGGGQPVVVCKVLP